MATDRWQVRWSGVVSRWADPLGACRDGQRHARVELVVDLELLAASRVSAEAWIEVPSGRSAAVRRQVLDRHVSEATVLHDGAMCHIDASLPSGDRLSITLDVVEDRVLYAQGTLDVRAGLPAGATGPPRLRRIGADDGAER